MLLKTVKLLGKLCFITTISALSGCRAPGVNHSDRNEDSLYRMDTVKASESNSGLLEVGLRNLSTYKKHGLWYYYRESDLSRIEGFEEGIQTGPSIGFVTYEGHTRVVSLSYREDGKFNGPSIYLNGDSTINFYNYYVEGESVKSLFIDGEGYVEFGTGDTTYQVGRIPIDTKN